jgi:two-component system, LytTR family, response regulator
MKISCIIIDDQPNALSLLEEYVNKMPSLMLKGKFFDAIEAIGYLKKEHTDLIFSDINMPLLTGLELAEILPRDQKFIFTTAFAEHALNSFSYYVIDYLLKPITFKRFVQAVNKVEVLLASGTGNIEQKNTIVFAKSGKKIVRIDFDEVLYIKGEKEYVSIHLENDRLLVYKRMKEMEALLPSCFKRIHISYIINVNYIRKVEMNHVLVGAENIPISIYFREPFLQFLNEKMM